MDDRTYDFWQCGPNGLGGVGAEPAAARRAGERGVIYLDISARHLRRSTAGRPTTACCSRWQALAGLKGELLTDGGLVALAVRSDQFVVFVGPASIAATPASWRSCARSWWWRCRRLKIQIGKEVPRGLGVHAASSVLKCDPTVRIERSIYKVLDTIRLSATATARSG
jgi:hypothetical protein